MQSELLASFYLAGMYSGLVKAYPNCTLVSRHCKPLPFLLNSALFTEYSPVEL